MDSHSRTRNMNRQKQDATEMNSDQKSGTRPFSPIYNNFQNLLDHNQGVFRLFRKAKNPGMYQAVWLSRQAEVETYQLRLEQTERKLAVKEAALSQELSNWESNERQWFEQLVEKKGEIEELKAQVKKAQEEINSQNSYISQLKDDSIRVSDQLREENKSLKDSHHDYVANLKSEFEREKLGLRHDLMKQREETEKFRILARSMERVIKMANAKDSKYEDQIAKLQGHLELAQHALIKLDEEYEQTQLENKDLTEKVYQLEEELENAQKYGKQYQRINHKMENELYRMTNELEEFQSRLN